MSVRGCRCELSSCWWHSGCVGHPACSLSIWLQPCPSGCNASWRVRWARWSCHVYLVCSRVTPSMHDKRLQGPRASSMFIPAPVVAPTVDPGNSQASLLPAVSTRSSCTPGLLGVVFWREGQLARVWGQVQLVGGLGGTCKGLVGQSIVPLRGSTIRHVLGSGFGGC